MNIQRITLLFFTFFCTPFLDCHEKALPYQALCTVPVADMVGEPLKNPESYRTLPPSWGTTAQDRTTCPRIHQLIFHEQAEVIDRILTPLDDGTTFSEVLVQISQCLVLDKTPAFWMPEECLIPLENIPKEHRMLIPMPINGINRNIECANQGVLTLASPYTYEPWQITFSAGTRFFIAQEDNENCHAYALNPLSSAVECITIPRTIALTPASSLAEKRQQFVRILHEWATTPGIIPYVWGGCSYCTSLEEDAFELRTLTTPLGAVLSYWHRTGTPIPITGFDCSGLVLRAAQIASLPLYAENTTTLNATLREITASDAVEAGDIIWFKGHVMVISDVENPHIIEARGYGAGFGKLHELPLHEIFHEIYTFEQLKHMSLEQKPVILLNNLLQPQQEGRVIKILKLI